MDGDECEQTFKAETSIGDNFEFGAEADTEPSTTNRKRGSTSGNSYKFPLRRTGLFSGKRRWRNPQERKVQTYGKLYNNIIHYHPVLTYYIK